MQGGGLKVSLYQVLLSYCEEIFEVQSMKNEEVSHIENVTNLNVTLL